MKHTHVCMYVTRNSCGYLANTDEYTDKTSLKADREDWGEGGGLLLAPQLD